MIYPIKEPFSVDNYSDGRICFRLENTKNGEVCFFSYYPMGQNVEGVLYANPKEGDTRKLIVDWRIKINWVHNTVTEKYDIPVYGFRASLLDQKDLININAETHRYCIRRSSISCGKVMRHLAKEWMWHQYLIEKRVYEKTAGKIRVLDR